jgi:beta-glucosidase
LREGNHDIYFGLTFWSPNINIFRDPRWGRGQETYGEDPYLTSQLGVNFIEGLQGQDPTYFKVIATPKHFAVHSGPESDRHKFDVDPSEHDLWDTYLPQFRAAIVDAKADSIMCSYNAVFGQPACGSKLLLGDVLRKDWHFQGFVTSDCGAIDDFYKPNTHVTEPDAEHAAKAALLAGTDTNCGSTYERLGAAVKAGLLKESDIDVSLVRLFEARMKLGQFDPPAKVGYAQIPFSAVHSSDNAAIARHAAEESMVLLKNDGILPLVAGKYKTIAGFARRKLQRDASRSCDASRCAAGGIRRCESTLFLRCPVCGWVRDAGRTDDAAPYRKFNGGWPEGRLLFLAKLVWRSCAIARRS